MSSTDVVELLSRHVTDFKERELVRETVYEECFGKDPKTVLDMYLNGTNGIREENIVAANRVADELFTKRSSVDAVREQAKPSYNRTLNIVLAEGGN